jgi:hypothetical protein
MKKKLPLWPVEMGEGRQYALEESHELSSWTGKLGNLTLEDDGSCGHLSLNKTVRSIDPDSLLNSLFARLTKPWFLAPPPPPSHKITVFCDSALLSHNHTFRLHCGV